MFQSTGIIAVLYNLLFFMSFYILRNKLSYKYSVLHSEKQITVWAYLNML